MAQQAAQKRPRSWPHSRPRNRQHSKPPHGRLNLLHNRPRKSSRASGQRNRPHRKPRNGPRKRLRSKASGSRRPDRFSMPPAPNPAPASVPFYPPQPQSFDYPGYTPSQASRPAPSQPQYARRHTKRVKCRPRFPWGATRCAETGSRPAWLSAERRARHAQPARVHRLRYSRFLKTRCRDRATAWPRAGSH